MRTKLLVSLAACNLLAVSLPAADLFEKLGLKKPASVPSISGLSEDQITSGLKEALANGVQQAVTNLGRSDGFLKDANVRIPMPENLRKVEKGLRAVGQTKLADDFVTTLNRAAEQAVPEAAGVLGDSVRQMTVADAKAILTGTNTAATAYFRRTSETNLTARFLPIVKKATEQTGVTAAYKQMIAKADVGGLTGLGSLGGLSLKKESLDLDAYVTRKALDGLFLKISEQEVLIRENPAARTTALLQQVFGSLGK
jgi:hypothetical protein